MVYIYVKLYGLSINYAHFPPFSGIPTYRIEKYLIKKQLQIYFTPQSL